MSKEKLVPQIRLEGFSGDWEEVKFRELGSIAMCKRIYKNETSENYEIPFYKIGTFGKEADTYISKEVYDKYKELYSFPSEGDILISAAGTIGRTVVYDGTPSYFQDSNIIWLNHTEEKILNEYLKHYYEIIEWDGIEGGTIKRLYNDIFLNSKIHHPNIEEQKIIAKILTNLNYVIEFREKELEKLNQFKQAMLQKIFPKEGETVPEVRFKGFEEEWKEVFLKDAAKVTMGQSPSGKNYTTDPNDYILVQGNADMKDSQVVPRVWTTQVTKTGMPGDIIMSVRAPVGDVGKTKYKVVLGRGVAGIRGNNFIYFYLEYLKENNYWDKLSTGSTFQSINSNHLNNLILFLPSEKEQQLIGEYFYKTDQNIKAKQTKLNKLIQFKQAMLDKMFV